MRQTIVARLACPICGAGLEQTGGSLRCADRHTFDIARTGYVSMLPGVAPGAAADTAAMVAARRRSLDAGHLEPVTDALADAAGGASLGLGAMVVDVGGGTGHHLAAVLHVLPEADGLVLDLSREAARVAARAHPRMSAVVCDIRHGLPLHDGSVALLLDVFAPREGAEMRRVIRPDGRLLVVTPRPSHLLELQDLPGILHVDARKEERLERTLGSSFRLDDRRTVEWRMQLDRAAVADLVSMGPSAHHVAPRALADALASFPDPMVVTGAVDLWVWSPG